MTEKKRFERMDHIMECKWYMTNEDIAESNEIFIYGFKH